MPGDLHTSLCDIHLDSTVGFCTPILTNTCIRECMAIIKIDREAFAHLKAFAAVIVSEQEPELCVDSKTLAKSCFNLQCKHVGAIEVTFKVILEPMGETRFGESLSVSVELVDPNKRELKGPFILSVYLENVKRKDEKTFRRQTKITPAGYRVERAMRNLFLTETIDQFFEKQSMLRIGVCIQRQKSEKG